MRAGYRRIFLCCPPGEYSGRILRGVGRFARENKHWLVERWWGAFEDALPVIAQARPSGVIMSHLSRDLTERLESMRLPFVACVIEPWMTRARVGTDDQEVGHIAARYFMGKGFTQFAFCGFSNEHWSVVRQQGYREALSAEGFDVHARVLPVSFREVWRTTPRLEAWLRGLPKPVGLFCSSDGIGAQLLQLCQILGLRVPEDVALLGVDNSEVDCEFSHPPLSSIETGVPRVGYAAAALLEEMLRGAPPPPEPVLVPPIGVVTRQSTDVLAVSDPEIATAIRFIRENAHRPLQVADVVEQTSLCRKTLEVRFRKILGHTPLEEIRRVHVERAKDLLLHTNLRISDIAQRSGCAHTPTLSEIFRRLTGTTPSSFRRQYRGVAAAGAMT